MYVKLFEQILDSSIAENYKTRLVFEDMLLLADQHGIVDITHEAFARRTNIPLDIVKTAIAELEKPDARSRRADQDGRRIMRLDDHRDWGWHIVNFDYYKNIRNDEERTAYMRGYIKDYRARGKDKSRPVNNGKHRLARLANAEAEAEAEAKKIAVKGKPSPPASRIKIVDQQWIEELRPDCKKQGIDLDAEIIKAKRWLLKAPGRKFTQKYFINWLNRCDKTLDIKTGRKSYSNQKDDIRDRAIAEIMDRLKTEHLATPEESFMEIAARLALSDKYKDIPGAVDKAVWASNYERKA